MFVYTWKFSKKKLTIAILAIVVLIAAILLIFSGGGEAKEAISLSGSARTAKDRVSLIKSLGWEIEEEPIETQSVVIPTEFTGVYADYAKLQEEQGFNLSKYAGKEATRYTYRVLNYPGVEDSVVIDIIVYRGKVIAGLNLIYPAVKIPEGVREPANSVCEAELYRLLAVDYAADVARELARFKHQLFKLLLIYP